MYYADHHRVSEHLSYFPDILPTVAELTGAKPLADIDGISLVPELMGEKYAGRAKFGKQDEQAMPKGKGKR